MFFFCSGVITNRAIIIGLAALYQWPRRAGRDPFPPTVEMRAVLSLLYLHSNGDRSAFDAYWKAATEKGLNYPSDLIASVVRSNNMRTAWHGIVEALGAYPSIDLMSAIAKVPTVQPPRDEKSP